MHDISNAHRSGTAPHGPRSALAASHVAQLLRLGKLRLLEEVQLQSESETHVAGSNKPQQPVACLTGN